MVRTVLCGELATAIVVVLIYSAAIATADTTNTYVCVERKSVGWVGDSVGAIKPNEEQFLLKYQPPKLDEANIVFRVGILEKVTETGSLVAGDSACDEILRSTLAVTSSENRKSVNAMCGSVESGHNFNSSANGQSWTFFPSLAASPPSVTYIYSLVPDERSSFMSSGTCTLAK